MSLLQVTEHVLLRLPPAYSCAPVLAASEMTLARRTSSVSMSPGVMMAKGVCPASTTHR